MASPEPENVALLRTVATTLSQCLERELVLLRFEGGRTTPQMKEVYDAVYLPRLIALSRQAARCVVFADLQLLCQPLHPDLADTQLRIIVELLYSLAVEF